jgi:acetylornithine deacetylase/succinyl-diaminopimelate desuccinylase-like protein
MSDSEKFAEHISRHRETWLEEVSEWLRIPSVSTDPARRDDMRAAAEWLVEKLGAAGCQETAVWPTDGHPVVFGAYNADEGAPTILVYGHYDVQPEDPIEGWEFPPFEPTVRDGRLFARGAVDDKGQLYVHVKALETWIAVQGSCPVNILYLIEGEEEVGSPNVGKVVEEKIGKLACDAVVISDTTMFAPGLPSLCYGLRGLAYCQIDVRGPKGDLHSGSFGGAVVNPGEALAWLLARCRDTETGAIAIPGFYDDLIPLTAEERREWAGLPFDEAAYKDDLGVAALSSEGDYGVLERLWARPTFEVNGLLSGFTGDGSKTVLPATAMAKVSMRLVPNQDPDTIMDAFEAHIRSIAPAGIELAFTRMQGARAWLAPRDHPVLLAAGRALERGFAAAPVYIREGGSIPLVSLLDDLLGVPSVLMGLGLPDENAHAPNENLSLENFYNGVASAVYFHEELARL